MPPHSQVQPVISVQRVDVGEREVTNHGFRTQQFPGHGNGLVATRAFKSGEQIMFVNSPVGLWLGDEAVSRELV